MVRFIKKAVVTAMTIFSCNAVGCFSMNSQKCKARPEVININKNDPLFYPYSSIRRYKYSGSRNNIDDPY